MRSDTYENERLRSVHLSIIVILTVSVVSICPFAISLQWREVWMLPLLVAGTLASWVLHIRQLLTAEQRLWFYALMSWAVVLLEGVHPTSLYGISIITALEFAMFSQANEKLLLHVSFILYLLLMLYQIVEIVSGNSIAVDSLAVSQLLLHFAIVLVIYRIGLNIITKREEDRARDRRAIGELEGMRKRTEDFMANVSHELRTPVNVVTGISSVLGGRLTNREDRADAAHILEAGKRLSDQVDDILDYTEIETGRLVISEEAYSISSVINDMMESLGVYTRNDLPQLIVDVDAAIPVKLLGDARRLKKILRHVTDNAIKFTKRGGVYVNVYQMSQTYGINLCIDVRDTGIGMSREVLERIREGIYQADAGRNREGSGYGLGLQIVFGIVHAMGGFARLDSTPGQGTHVHISIPQKVAAAGRCMEVAEPGRLKLAFFQRPEKFETPAVREYYLTMIRHVIEAFHLTLQRTSTLEECRKLLSEQTFTHLFVADEEYSEAPAYFDALCDTLHVIVVARQGFLPQQGSRVTILKKPLYAFPLVEVLNAKTAQEAKRALYGEEEIRFDGARALVVDDEEMNLVVARGIFADYGMIVETAGSGMEAIEKAGKTSYDIIFMDHMMPVMDGVEAARRIRDILHTENRRSAMVALTANAVSGAREMFLAEGFDGFIAKPIERTELVRVLRRVL